MVDPSARGGSDDDDDQPGLGAGGGDPSHGGRPDRAIALPGDRRGPSGPRAAAGHAGRDPGGVGRVEGLGVRRPRRPRRCWPAGAGGTAGRARPADDAQPAGLPLVRRRGAVPPGHAGQHLQLVVAGGDPVPGQPRRGGARGRRGRRLPRADPEGARRAPPAQADLRPPPAGRRPADGRAPGQRPPGAGPRRPARAGRGDLAGRSGHAHLHLRHDRAAEGRDDQPGQRRLHHRAAAPLLRARPLRVPGQAPDLLPADGAHRRADDQPLPRHGVGPVRHVVPRPDPDRGVRPRGAPRDHVRRAPGVGEGVPRRQRRAGRGPGEAAEVRGGAGGRPGDQGRRAGRHGDAGAEGHVGLPRRSRVPARSAPCSGWTP